MTAQEIISIIGLIGIGGILKSIFNLFINNKKQKSETQHQFKETRYKAIILLIYAYINYEKEKNKIISHRPDINSKDLLYDEIYAEWINMTLFASDEVILKMKNFLDNPVNDSFNKTILSMRKDLYGIKSKIKINNLLK
jgi:hypothetical protein